MEVEITRGRKPHPEFGMISRIDLPDTSRIYISKKGWNLLTPDRPDRKEIGIPWAEIQLAIDESIRQGYVKNKKSEKRRKQC